MTSTATAEVRRVWLRRNASAGFIFAVGCLTAPSLIIHGNLFGKLSQILLFLTLVYLVGKSVKFMRLAIFVLSAVVFNVLTPVGRVIATIWFVRITEGALESGLSKAVTLTGLLLVSKFSISDNLHLPGRVGQLVAATTNLLNALLRSKPGFSSGSPVDVLDRVFAASAYEFERRTTSLPNKTTIEGLFFLFTAAMSSWGIALISVTGIL